MSNLRPLSLEVYKIWISLDRNLRPHIGAFPPLKKTDQRQKILWIPWLFLLKDPSEEQT